MDSSSLIQNKVIKMRPGPSTFLERSPKSWQGCGRSAILMTASKCGGAGNRPLEIIWDCLTDFNSQLHSILTYVRQKTFIRIFLAASFAITATKN